MQIPPGACRARLCPLSPQPGAPWGCLAWAARSGDCSRLVPSGHPVVMCHHSALPAASVSQGSSLGLPPSWFSLGLTWCGHPTCPCMEGTRWHWHVQGVPAPVQGPGPRQAEAQMGIQPGTLGLVAEGWELWSSARCWGWGWGAAVAAPIAAPRAAPRAAAAACGHWMSPAAAAVAGSMCSAMGQDPRLCPRGHRPQPLWDVEGFGGAPVCAEEPSWQPPCAASTAPCPHVWAHCSISP